MKLIAIVLFSLFCYSQQQTFVTPHGTDFYLDGKKFYFQGNNLYYISLLDGKTSEQQVNDLLWDTKNKGCKVVRFWGFSNGNWYGMPTMQPSLGQFNEAALKRLDFAIAKTKEMGMKAIIPLVNNWPDFNGMQWYVDQVYPNQNKPKDTFYTDGTVKSKYKAWVNYLLNRKNSITGVQYKSDPTIFSWELANEPSNQGNDNSGNKVYNWLKEMSEFVHSIDANHMISTGEEGYGSGGDPNDWVENGFKGIDFKKNTGLPLISYGSIHIYPDARHWAKSLDWVDNWLRAKKSVCNSFNKPCVLVEYGRSDLDGDRLNVFKRWHATGQAAKYNGMMVWQMEKDLRDKDSEKYMFTMWDPASKLIEENAKVMNAKSN